MELFAARDTHLLHDLPPLACLPVARGLPFRGVGRFPHAPAGYLAFVERMPALEDGHAPFEGMLLAPIGLADRIKAAFPTATLLPLPDPRATFIDVIDHLQRIGGLHASSLLPPVPSISPGARIEPGAIVDPGVHVDDDVHVASGAVVRKGTWLKRGVRIGENCVLGTTGINAYAGLDGARRGFPHLAGLIVGEGTTIGANSVIVRGILSSTRIGAGCTIGNLCNLGHGVEIDADTWISVGTLVGGHTSIGARATIAIGCTLRDNLRIGAGANIGMGSVVTKPVRAGASVFGNPARTCAPLSTGPTR